MKDIFVGQTIGMLTVLREETGVFKVRKRKTWGCQCICGTIVYASTNNLKTRPNRSCGKCVIRKKPQKDLTNQRFGKLTVITPELGKNRKKHFTWKCRCDCGNISYLTTSVLKSGHSKSCGCGELENKRRNCNVGRTKRTKNRKDPKIQLANWLFIKNYSDGDLSFEQFLNMSQEHCFYCNAPPSNRLKISSKARSQEYRDASLFIYNGLDRINNNLPHNLNNLVPCCKNCNFAKRDRKFEEFIEWIKKAHDNLKNKNIIAV